MRNVNSQTRGEETYLGDLRYLRSVEPKYHYYLHFYIGRGVCFYVCDNRRCLFKFLVKNDRSVL